MKNDAPNLVKYMTDMNNYFNPKKEVELPPAPTHAYYLFKEDWKRVDAYRSRMLRKALNRPTDKTSIELQCLVNTLAYMLEKFEIRECPGV